MWNFLRGTISKKPYKVCVYKLYTYFDQKKVFFTYSVLFEKNMYFVLKCGLMYCLTISWLQHIFLIPMGFDGYGVYLKERMRISCVVV